jgi:hypothetical protein
MAVKGLDIGDGCFECCPQRGVESFDGCVHIGHRNAQGIKLDAVEACGQLTKRSITLGADLAEDVSDGRDGCITEEVRPWQVSGNQRSTAAEVKTVQHALKVAWPLARTTVNSAGLAQCLAQCFALAGQFAQLLPFPARGTRWLSISAHCRLSPDRLKIWSNDWPSWLMRLKTRTMSE